MINDFLPDEFMSKCIVTMTMEYAWKYTDVVDVINYLSDKECVILGGDVLNNYSDYTYDNWSYNYNNSLSLEDNIRESTSKAFEYVSWYNKKFGDKYYYIIVITK